MSDNMVPPPGASDPNSSAGSPQPSIPPAGGATPKRSSGLGVAALVLGIVALGFAFIPFANYFGMVLAVVGLVLGVIGLLAKTRAKGMPVAGTVLSAVALVLAIVMAVVYAAAFSAVAKSVNDAGNSIVSSSAPSASASGSATSSTSNGKELDVVYSVKSDASTAESITYFTLNNGQSGQEQANGAALPWSKDLTLEQSGLLDFNSMSLTAQAAQNATTITCTITVNGVVKATQTSTGSFAVVSCSTDGK